MWEGLEVETGVYTSLTLIISQKFFGEGGFEKCDGRIAMGGWKCDM